MAIFPKVTIDPVIQVNDGVRIDATRTYVSSDEEAITLVEIRPTTTGSFIDVTGSSSSDWYLDYQYDTAQSETIAIRVTTDGIATTLTKTVAIISVADDKLLSGDDDLLEIETGILDFLKPGRTSFINIHRASLKQILNELDRRKIWDTDGNKLTKDDLVTTLDFRLWSVYLTLAAIYLDAYNSTDEVFLNKGNYYLSLAKEEAARGALRLDRDGDGVTDSAKLDNKTVGLLKR